MERWEPYLLGVLGIPLAITSLVLQVVALAAGNLWTALALTLGTVTGALLYRTGFSLLSR